MIIDIVTIFPKFYDEFLETSIIKRAIRDGKVIINIHDIREYSGNKHNQVDDTPYGGGVGMLMTFPPFYRILNKIKTKDTKVIFLSPQGKIFDQQAAKEYKEFKHIVLLSGHYEGIDARVLELVDYEVSIGNFVLTGGEIPAMVITDAVVRLIPDVIQTDSHETDSLENDRLKYPQYTKPEHFEGFSVPSILLSGNHGKIEEYRKYMSIKSTIEKRPDLILKSPLTNDEKKLLEKYK